MLRLFLLLLRLFVAIVADAAVVAAISLSLQHFLLLLQLLRVFWLLRPFCCSCGCLLRLFVAAACCGCLLRLLRCGDNAPAADPVLLNRFAMNR